MTTETTSDALQLVVVNAGTSDPSSTKLLADRTATRVRDLAAELGETVVIRSIELKPLAGDIMNALTTGLLSSELERVSQRLLEADGLIASTPIYKAGPSGLFTSFFQVLDNDLLIGKPVILTATAGSPRHALVIDDQIRGLFAYLRTLPVPTSLFASPDDWNGNDLGTRIDRAATELTLLMRARYATEVKERSWGRYQHSFGSAGGTELGIDFDSDLMRLATGGRA